MTIKLTYIAFLTFCLMGCACSKQSTDEQNNAILDLNSDGKKDIFYEFDDSGSYELVDRNFDGKVDESHHYDNENRLLSSKLDDDLDGYLETKVIYKYETIEKMAVDSDNDNLYEIFYFYKSGTLENAIKYYQEEGVNKIGKVNFKFGYPIGEEIIEITNMTKVEFQKLGKIEN